MQFIRLHFFILKWIISGFNLSNIIINDLAVEKLVLYVLNNINEMNIVY